MKSSKKLSVSKIIMGIILIFLAASMLIPMLNILAQSLSHPDKVHALKAVSYTHLDVYKRQMPGQMTLDGMYSLIAENAPEISGVDILSLIHI